MYTASRGALCNRHLPRLPRHSRHHRPPVRRRPPTRPRQAAPFSPSSARSRPGAIVSERPSSSQAAAGAGPDTRRSTRSLGGQIIADDSWNALRPHTNRKKTRKCAQAFWPDAKELGSVRPRPARRAATPATTPPPPPPLSARGLDNANARARRSSCQGTLWWWRWRFHPVQ